MTIIEYPEVLIGMWPYNESEEFYQFFLLLECLQTQVFLG